MGQAVCKTEVEEVEGCGQKASHFVQNNGKIYSTLRSEGCDCMVPSLSSRNSEHHAFLRASFSTRLPQIIILRADYLLSIINLNLTQT